MVGYGAEGMALRFSAAAAPRRLIWFSAVAIWPAISLVLGEALQTASMRPGAKRRDHVGGSLPLSASCWLASMRPGAKRRDHARGGAASVPGAQASMRPGAKRRDHAPKPACTVASFSLLQ